MLTRSVGDETVLLDLANEEYFGLEGVGARFVELAGGGRTYGETVSALLDEYDVSEDVLRHDLDVLITELHAKRLVEVDGT